MEIVFLVEFEEQIANCSLRSRGKSKNLLYCLSILHDSFNYRALRELHI